MLEQKIVLDEFLKNDLIAIFTNYHGILTPKFCVLKANDAINIAFKIVNSIRSRSLYRCQCRALFEEIEALDGTKGENVTVL